MLALKALIRWAGALGCYENHQQKNGCGRHEPPLVTKVRPKATQTQINHEFLGLKNHKSVTTNPTEIRFLTFFFRIKPRRNHSSIR